MGNMTKHLFPFNSLPLPSQTGDTIELLREAVRLKSEESLKCLFHLFVELGGVDDRVPINLKIDSIAYNLPTRMGVIDVAVFHADGTATVFVIRNGSKGYRHVCQGIGLAALHAVQLAEGKAKIKKVSRAVVWTSTGGYLLATDVFATQACESAGVMPIVWQLFSTCLTSLKIELDAREAEAKMVSGASAMPAGDRVEVPA